MWTDGLLGWIVAVAPLAGIAWYLVGTPGVVALAAVVPALAYAAVLAGIARGARVRPGAAVVLFAVAWGAGVAALASTSCGATPGSRGSCPSSGPGAGRRSRSCSAAPTFAAPSRSRAKR